MSEDRGTPFRDGPEDCRETSTAQHIIYNTKGAVRSPPSCENFSATRTLELLFPSPAPPRKKDQQPPQKRLPPVCRHQCAAGIDPIGSPHPRIQCSGPLQKDPHPEPASGRALTPSRTRFSSPLAMRGKQRRALFQQPSQKERNRDVCPRNGPGLPPTGPSPGPNPPTYPSSLPRALAKLPRNIPSRGHGFFFNRAERFLKICFIITS